MKKIIILSALLLVSSGCIKTVPEAIDDKSSGKVAEQPCQSPKAMDGALIYRNDKLGFEFQPGKYSYKEIQQQDASGYDVIFSLGSEKAPAKIIVRHSDENFEQTKARLQKDQDNGLITQLQEIQIDCQKGFLFEEPGAPGFKNAEIVTSKRMYMITWGFAESETLSTFHFFAPK